MPLHLEVRVIGRHVDDLDFLRERRLLVAVPLVLGDHSVGEVHHREFHLHRRGRRCWPAGLACRDAGRSGRAVVARARRPGPDDARAVGGHPRYGSPALRIERQGFETEFLRLDLLPADRLAGLRVAFHLREGDDLLLRAVGRVARGRVAIDDVELGLVVAGLRIPWAGTSGGSTG